eukprot:2582346-Amphidinium_carterae.1
MCSLPGSTEQQAQWASKRASVVKSQLKAGKSLGSASTVKEKNPKKRKQADDDNHTQGLKAAKAMLGMM